MPGLSPEWYRKNILPSLASGISGTRWFGGKGRRIRDMELIDFGYFRAESPVMLPVVRVDYEEGPSETYFIPQARKQAIGGTGQAELLDAVPTRDFLWRILQIMKEGAHHRISGGTLEGTMPVRPAELPENDDFRISVVSGEQSNSSVMIDGRFIYKCFRKISEGENPDYYVPLFLRRNCRFDWVPDVYGKVTYNSRGRSYHIGTLSRYLKGSVDGWSHIGSMLDRIRAQPAGYDERGTREILDELSSEMGILGRTTAGMHNCFSSNSGIGRFQPEPIMSGDVMRWKLEYSALLEDAMKALEPIRSPGHTMREDAEAAYRNREKLSSIGEELDIVHGMALHKTRIHGDYHLGQTLRNGDGYYIIDFEGEPMRTLRYREGKFCPLKDTAGMARSIDYAVLSRLGAPGMGIGAELMREVEGTMRTGFLDSYFDSISADFPVLPATEEVRKSLLRFYEAEKALYELVYEANNRPGHLWIPLEALARLASS